MQPLLPGTATGPLLNSIDITPPDGRWYYAIHVIGQFFNWDGLADLENDDVWGETWSDPAGPSDRIRDSLVTATGRQPIVDNVLILGARDRFVIAGQTATLNAHVEGTNVNTAADREVVWTSAPAGQVARQADNSGLVSATAAQIGQTFEITATSAHNPAQSDMVRVHVIPYGAIGIITDDGRVWINHGGNIYQEIVSPGVLGPKFSAGPNMDPTDDAGNVNVYQNNRHDIVVDGNNYNVYLVGPNTDSNGNTYFWMPGTSGNLFGQAPDRQIWADPDFPNFTATNPGSNDIWAIAITPTAPSVTRGQTVQLTAAVTLNGATVSVPTGTTWAITSGNQGSSISAAGLVTTVAGQTAPFVVTATLPTGETATVTVTTTAPIGVGGTFTQGGVEWVVVSTQMGPTGHGSGTDILVMSRHVLNVGTQWNPTNVTAGGYNASAIRTALTNFYNTQTWAHTLAREPGTTHANGTWNFAGGTVGWNTEITTSPGVAASTNGAFLLSYADVLAFFPTPASRVAQNTTGGGAIWWLRSPNNATGARSVGTNGGFFNNNASTTNRGFRPALILTNLP